ncbi:MAG: hypothetical protein ABR577_14455 [Pyrinomonadaceae bacterium]
MATAINRGLIALTVISFAKSEDSQMSDGRSVIQQYEISKDLILANKRPIYPKVTGIYFLIRGSEIVYVGQSVDIMNRIAQHSREALKEFDSFSMLECPAEYLATLEAYFIFKFRPRLNSSLPPNQLYKSFQQIKRIHDISALVLKLWMKHNSIENDKDSLYCLNDFDGIADFKRWMRERHPNVYLRQCSIGYLKDYIRELSAHVEGAG